MPLAERVAHLAPLRRSGSLGDLLRAQIGHAKLAQELLLASNPVRVRLRCSCDSLAVRHGKLFEMGLSLCFPSRFAPRVELIASAGVVGGLASSAMRLVAASLGAVHAEVGLRLHHAAARAGSRVVSH